ncbi:MAG: hypothetical protein ACE5MK_11975 [Acidobacteriota bacterium]
MQCSAGRRSQGVLKLVTAAAVLHGCTFAVPIHPTIDPTPEVPQAQVILGVYYNPEFRGYEHVALVGGGPTPDRLVISLGQASVSLFDLTLPRLFKSVRPASGRPALKPARSEVAAVIEPSIERVEYPGGFVSVVPFWTEITYRFKLYSAAGESIAEWSVTGVGEKTPSIIQRTTLLYGNTTELAMEDAARKFLQSFWSIPEIHRWSEQMEILTPR